MVELIHGEFKEKDTLKIDRLEDRVLFLCRRFSKAPVDRTLIWSEFVDASRLRNSLTHPKADPPNISENAVKKSINALIELLNQMYDGSTSRSFQPITAVSLPD